MTTLNTAQTPTPWTDARSIFRNYNHTAIKHELGADVEAEDCRTLERHLRRIIAAWEVQEPDWATPLDAAIQAAKETLNK